MNKVTLSLVALAAVGGTAQVQAADMTQEQKDAAIAAKKAAIDEIRLTLNAVSNQINADCPDVKADALLLLSGITKDLNDKYDNDNCFEVPDVKEYVDLIGDIKDDAVNAQKPYNTKASLVAKYNTMKAEYDKALTNASDKVKYPHVSADKVETLKKQNVEAILARINAYNLADQTIVNEAGEIENRIKSVSATIKQVNESIDQDEKNARSNEDANKAVIAAYNIAKANYDAQLDEAIKKLPSDNYKDYQETVVEKLNEQYRIIVAAKKSNDALYAQEKAAEEYSANVENINNANSVITNIVAEYVGKMESQENALKNANSEIAKLSASLKDVKTKLDQRGLTECDADIAAILKSIDDLNAEISAQYKTHTISSWVAGGKYTAIQLAINNIDDNNGHSAQALCDNYDANKSMVASVADVQEKLNAAETTAKTASDDKAYNAAAHYTATLAAVQKNIDALSKAVSAAYAGKTAVKYKNETLLGKLDAITTGTTDYAKNTAAALAAYNTAAKTIVDQNKLLEALKKEVSDPNVTVDGKVGGVSYQATIDNVAKEIQAIQKKIVSANAKADAAHLGEMQAAAGMKVAENLAQLTADYKANKTAFDLASAQNSAQSYLAQAQTIIKAQTDALDKISADRDFGNKQADVDAKKAELVKKVGDVQKLKDAAQTEYDAVNNDTSKTAEEKMNAAATAIAKLAEVDKQLEALGKDVKELSVLADNAEANKKAYDETIILANNTSSARTTLNAINDYIVNFSDEATPYYQGEITKLKAKLTNTETAINTAYAKQESKAKKEGFIETINAIVQNANTLKAAVQPNLNQYKAQAQAAKDLKNTWQTTYDAISVNDLSDAAAEYLKNLAPLREQVNALADQVLADFKAGKSVAQQQVNDATNKDLASKILAIGAQSKDNYDANVAETNAKKHATFVESNYDAAYKAFSNAVDVLNQFTKIEDASVKKFVNEDDELVKVHEGIYAYADKLRNLKTAESDDYATFVNQTNKEYGKYDMYNPAKWVTMANQYQAEINAALVTYQDKVNQKAYDIYNIKVTDADNSLATYKAQIADFVYDGKSKAFQNVETVVNEAKLAGAVENGTIKDKLYAVHVDKWNKTLDNVVSLLDADLKAACNAEKSKLVADATALYDAEKTAIASFKEIDNADYLKQLDNLKAATIDKAMVNYQATPAFVNNTVRVKCAAYANGLEHSTIYTTAYNLSVANVKNMEAYGRMIAKLDAATTSWNAAVEDLGTLMATHSSILNAQIKSLSNDLSTKKADTEAAKEVGACVALEATINDFVDTELKTGLASLQKNAINTEIKVLGLEIDKVKEEYNQVAKTDLDKVKDYDAQIKNDLYKVLLTDSEAGSNVKTSIQWKWENGKLSYDVARVSLVSHEAKIAQIKAELNALYTNDKAQVAIAAIDKQVSDIEAAVAQAATWAAYNKATQEYQADVQDVKAQLDKAKANYEAKKNAILLYQDVLAFDLTQIANANVLVSNDLQVEYNKQKTNDDVFTALNVKVNAAKASLETAYNNVKDMKYAGLESIKTWNEQVANAISDLSTEISKQHKAVLLTSASVFDADFTSIADQTKKHEIQAKFNQANGLIYDLNDELIAIQRAYEDGNYSDSRRVILRNEGVRISTSLWNAYIYNADVKADNKVEFDIDGNDVRVEINGVKYGIDEDYLLVTWKNLETRISELQTAAKQLAEDATTYQYVVGDADGNGKVNVNDYNEARNLVLTSAEFTEVDEAKAYAADVDGDKEFTVADMTKISNIIFHGNPNGATDGIVRARMMIRGAEGDDIAINKQSEETTVFGKTVKIAVNVSGAQEFTAGQFDIQLPTGMKLAGQELTDRANGHELYSNELGDGLYRFVAATIENTAFSGNNGALVVLDVEVGTDYAGGEITVANGIFSDAKGNAYALGARSIGGGNGTTGIGSITAPTAKERIYSVGGMVKKAVQKGINIIKREDGTARKVVKK